MSSESNESIGGTSNNMIMKILGKMHRRISIVESNRLEIEKIHGNNPESEYNYHGGFNLGINLDTLTGLIIV